MPLFGNPPGFGMRKASAAVALASIEGMTPQERDATYFAGLLHAIGTIGNPAYKKGHQLDQRSARVHAWDVPAHGARLCAGIAALPAETADFVRWQSECWDGTGYPDQLRWHGIPRNAQHLALADALLRASDPEEALGAIGLQSGRAFSPEAVRIFVTWFHGGSGEIALETIPNEALDGDATAPETLLMQVADRVDEHNGVPGRWQRVERLALATAQAMHFDDAALARTALAARLFGAGELTATVAEDSAFDPLARLGIDGRMRNGAAAASFVADIPSLRNAAEILRARSEWFDGTGKPRGLRAKAIPPVAAVLAAAIAYERLDRGERLDTAAGTQFDPVVVRAMLDVAKTRT